MSSCSASGPRDVHAVARADVPVRARRDDHGVHLALGAVLVVAAQVARVGSRLVEVGLVGLFLALEFEDDDGAADEQDDVGSARLQRQLVLEDRGVGVGEVVEDDDLADLMLQLGNGVVPREDLRFAHVGEELLERDPDDFAARFRRRLGSRSPNRSGRGPSRSA